MSRHIVITGGNRGIGLEIVKSYVANGDKVTVLCRQSSDDLDSLNVKVITNVDVTDMNSIKKAKHSLEGQSVDILINNAGLLTQEAIEEFDDRAIERINTQFQINSLGPLMVTAAFLDLLQEGAKVVLITSRMGSVEDNDSGTRYGYRMSKAALNMAGKSLSIDLAPRGIAVALLHPGWIQTAMTGYTGHTTPDNAAASLVERIEALNLENTGTFWHANGEKLPW